MIEPEVWLITWFCLFPNDIMCRSIEGRTGNLTFANSEECRVFAEHGVHEFRTKLRIELAFVCTHIIDVWRPTPRPKVLRRPHVNLYYLIR